MTLRTITAGLLVGLVGLAGLAAALAVEYFGVKQVNPFLAAHPELFPVTPHRALLGLLALTVWLGVAYGFLFQQAFAQPPSLRAALTFG